MNNGRGLDTRDTSTTRVADASRDPVLPRIVLLRAKFVLGLTARDDRKNTFWTTKD